MSNRYLLVIAVIVVLVIALFPAWPYSHGWGYYPSGGIGLLGLILIVALVAGWL